MTALLASGMPATLIRGILNESDFMRPRMKDRIPVISPLSPNHNDPRQLFDVKSRLSLSSYHMDSKGKLENDSFAQPQAKA